MEDYRSTRHYVLATSRPWNEVLACRLQERTRQTFHLLKRI